MKKVKETLCAFIYVLIDSVRWKKEKLDFDMRTRKEVTQGKKWISRKKKIEKSKHMKKI